MFSERSDWQSSLNNEGYLRKEACIEIEDSWYLQILPSIRPHPCTVYIMWIPAPYRIEALRLQIQGSFQSWRIMESEIGTEPIENPRLGWGHAEEATGEVVVIEVLLEVSARVARCAKAG